VRHRYTDIKSGAHRDVIAIASSISTRPKPSFAICPLIASEASMPPGSGSRLRSENRWARGSRQEQRRAQRHHIILLIVLLRSPSALAAAFGCWGLHHHTMVPTRIISTRVVRVAIATAIGRKISTRVTVDAAFTTANIAGKAAAAPQATFNTAWTTRRAAHMFKTALAARRSVTSSLNPAVVAALHMKKVEFKMFSSQCGRRGGDPSGARGGQSSECSHEVNF
jgi:hypothetical protein